MCMTKFILPFNLFIGRIIASDQNKSFCDEYVGGSSESHIYQISHVVNLRPSDFIIQPVRSLLFETSFLTWNFVSRSKIKLMVVLYCFARLNKHPFRISKYQNQNETCVHRNTLRCV